MVISSAPSVETVLDRLLAHFGDPAPRPPNDSLDELIATILSQHTSDTSTEQTFASLEARFPGWDAVEAPTTDVAEAICSGGLAQLQAPRIQWVLRTIHERRSEYSLAFLNDLPVAEARDWLTSLDGVGPNTAACVLLFACTMPALPVDTHVHRVSKRLGLIGPDVGEAAESSRLREHRRLSIAPAVVATPAVDGPAEFGDLAGAHLQRGDEPAHHGRPRHGAAG